MSPRKTYTVTVEREPGFWIIRVPEIDSVVTQARRLADVRENAREAIAVWSNVPLSNVDVTLNLVVPPVIEKAIEDARLLRTEASERLDRASAVVSEAARKLTKDLGLTFREAAEILGISFQRVAQLVGDNGKKSPDSRKQSAAKPKSHVRKIGV